LDRDFYRFILGYRVVLNIRFINKALWGEVSLLRATAGVARTGFASYNVAWLVLSSTGVSTVEGGINGNNGMNMVSH
jgi:hypothetical protein